MNQLIHCALTLAIALTGSACNDETQAAAQKSLEAAREGARQTGDAMLLAWDAAVADLSAKAGDFKAKIDAATPEMKAKLEALQVTFDEQLALAKQKLDEARAAAPEHVETLKREAREALDGAKQAWRDATGN